jgi:DNA ligase-1
MREVYNIITQLRNTSSRNDKERILKENLNNELFRKVLYYTYNPFLKYGISNETMIPISSWKSAFDDFFKMLDILAKSNINNELRIEVGYFLSHVEPHKIKQMYIDILLKDLKIGVNTKTINKIFGDNFIPEFNVMLAEKYFECEDKVKGEFIVTQKLDGVRCVIIKENDNIKIFSRQGQPIEDLIEIQEEAKLLPNNMVYDGELIL